MKNPGLLGILLALVTSCSATLMSIDSLREQGYQRNPMTYVTQTGERRENPNYELWWKESRDTVRRVHFCIVPKVIGGGYNWRVTLFVDDKQTWAYESGALTGKPNLKQGIDCAISAPISDGRLSVAVNYVYWQ